MSVNKQIILGNLGTNPELRFTQSGQAVATMRIATNENWTDKAGVKQQRTEWHRVIVWGKRGENCAKYLVQGQQAYVEGRTQTREWTDKDGIKRYMREVIAERVDFGPRVQASMQAQQQLNTMSEEDVQQEQQVHLTDSDIPF